MVALEAQETDLMKATPDSPGGGVEAFTFKDVTFTVKVADKEGKGKVDKKIIQGISGRVVSGHVLAILGPSGAGKTTLINVLTLSAFGGEAVGTVKLNEDKMTQSLFMKSCFVVTQQDNHWPFLTCKQTLAFAAELYLNDTKEKRAERVDDIIKRTGLESCMDTRVGNEFMQGLSGGQKRRLSIALALIKQPKLIFLDEPTSGLDAAAAAGIMEFITELAQQKGLIIVATIHQPSSKVYSNFDEVMILSKGREAYSGTAPGAVEYFASIGKPIPDHTNPAEFFLDLVLIASLLLIRLFLHAHAHSFTPQILGG